MSDTYAENVERISMAGNEQFDTASMQTNMNEYLPLRDVVFNTLRQAILRGELKPGERLMEIHLADLSLIHI